MEVAAGSFVGILGPNGSGKTTLLRVLAGTRAPSAGRVTLDGADLAHTPRTVLARRMAVVPQETRLAFEYNVLEVVLMGRYPHLGAFEIEGPAARVDVIVVAMGHPAPQVLQTTRLNKRIAFEIEEDISGGGLRQAAQSASWFELKKLVHRPPRLAPIPLNARLLPDPLVAFRSSAPRLPRKRQQHMGQTRERSHIAPPELPPLQA